VSVALGEGMSCVRRAGGVLIGEYVLMASEAHILDNSFSYACSLRRCGCSGPSYCCWLITSASVACGCSGPFVASYSALWLETSLETTPSRQRLERSLETSRSGWFCATVWRCLTTVTAIGTFLLTYRTSVMVLLRCTTCGLAVDVCGCTWMVIG